MKYTLKLLSLFISLFFIGILQVSAHGDSHDHEKPNYNKFVDNGITEAKDIKPYLVGQIQNEKKEGISGLNVNILDSKTGVLLCFDKTKTSGLIGIDCDFKKGKEYKYTITNKQNVVISKGNFTVTYPIVTVGRNDYNEIKVGFYSQIPNMSLFSDDYKKIVDKLNERNIDPNRYAGTPHPDVKGKPHRHAGDWGVEVYKGLQLYFICSKDEDKRPERVNYTLSYKGQIVENGYDNLSRGLNVGFPINLKFIDGKKEKRIEIKDGNLPIVVPFENCIKGKTEQIKKPTLATDNINSQVTQNKIFNNKKDFKVISKKEIDEKQITPSKKDNDKKGFDVIDKDQEAETEKPKPIQRELSKTKIIIYICMAILGMLSLTLYLIIRK